MKRLAIVGAAIGLLFLAASGPAEAKEGASTEQTLKQLEQDWTDAAIKKDSAGLGKILAHDWVSQGTSGETSREKALAEISSGDNRVESMTLSDLKVRVFGDTAVVTGSDDEKSSHLGKDTSGHYVWTDVFVRRDGRWQATASQGTLVPPKPAP
jgi:ketosteroid isomerase-like protein